MSLVDQVTHLSRSDGTTTCTRCGQIIPAGRRVATITGTGDTCLKCLTAEAIDQDLARRRRGDHDDGQADEDDEDEPDQ